MSLDLQLRGGVWRKVTQVVLLLVILALIGVSYVRPEVRVVGSAAGGLLLVALFVAFRKRGLCANRIQLNNGDIEFNRGRRRLKAISMQKIEKLFVEAGSVTFFHRNQNDFPVSTELLRQDFETESWEKLTEFANQVADRVSGGG